MTTQPLHDTGEEYTIKNGLSGTYTVALFEDGELSGSGDNLNDSSDIGDITTEPGGSNYAQQSATFSVADLSGDWGIQNDSLIEFNTLDSSRDVDAVALIVNFQSADKGDSSANDHLLGTTTLTQTRNLSDYSSIDYAAGDLTLKIT